MTRCPSFVHDLIKRSNSVKLLTLAIVHKDGRLLLGHKKRGFGTGYYNGFGGKVEAGETIEQAAYRELEEEAGIKASQLLHQGVLTFAFDDQDKPWEVHVFRVPNFTGSPTESEEMRPMWFDPQDIPYGRMWADDVFWYPLFLKGATFRGLFAFSNTHDLVWHRLLEEGDLHLPAEALLEETAPGGVQH